MSSRYKSLLAAMVLCAVSGSYAFADGGRGRGSPAPIAGAGLSFLLIAGGYAVVRLYRRKAE
jgi:hypothetical protein